MVGEAREPDSGAGGHAPLSLAVDRKSVKASLRDPGSLKEAFTDYTIATRGLSDNTSLSSHSDRA
ncbi:hypothetical protein SAMN04489733_3158 [Amycolatopsis keratiniphila]|nr:hypothetical protein SAMN04489733_3158 [Amycolatopsis keratiniphila]